MRGKRSKLYRKLMHQYALTFNFREPYQVLIDAQMLQDSHRCKMDLVTFLSRTLHGEVKPMITQCSIRHIYALPTTSSASAPSDAKSPSSRPPITEPDKTALLNLCRTLTLRRCNHHTLPSPLSALECYQSVVDPKGSSTNKHRYVLAVQDEDIRQWARTVKGVPTVFIRRSVMIMEPMADVSLKIKRGEERGKLRAGIRKLGSGKKRKREEDGDEDGAKEAAEEIENKKRKAYGTKGPNPLSVKKKKARVVPGEGGEGGLDVEDPYATIISEKVEEMAPEGTTNIKRKRRRRHKNTGGIDEVKAGQDDALGLVVVDGGS